MYVSTAPQARQHDLGEEVADYWVAVSVDGGDHSTLLALASALHRRGVDVLSAQLSWPIAGRRSFEATIRATPRAARTVEGTLRNLIRVTHVSMARCGDRALQESLS
jgi:hypothetical protein